MGLMQNPARHKNTETSRRCLMAQHWGEDSKWTLVTCHRGGGQCQGRAQSETRQPLVSKDAEVFNSSAKHLGWRLRARQSRVAYRD